VKNKVNTKDSLRIVSAFVPPFTNVDSVYTSFRTIFSKNEMAIDLLNLNYAKAFIMTGKPGKADTLITSSISSTGFDTNSLANARYANSQAAIEAYKQKNDIIGHNGSDPGVFTAMYFNPKTKIGTVVLVNTDTDFSDNVWPEIEQIWKSSSDYQNTIKVTTVSRNSWFY